jgi:hypothetical protein
MISETLDKDFAIGERSSTVLTTFLNAKDRRFLGKLAYFANRGTRPADNLTLHLYSHKAVRGKFEKKFTMSIQSIESKELTIFHDSQCLQLWLPS